MEVGIGRGREDFSRKLSQLTRWWFFGWRVQLESRFPDFAANRGSGSGRYTRMEEEGEEEGRGKKREGYQEK